MVPYASASAGGSSTKQLVTDCGGLRVDMQTIVDGFKGKRYFSQLNFASGFDQLFNAESKNGKKLPSVTQTDNCWSSHGPGLV